MKDAFTMGDMMEWPHHISVISRRGGVTDIKIESREHAESIAQDAGHGSPISLYIEGCLGCTGGAHVQGEKGTPVRLFPLK